MTQEEAINAREILLAEQRKVRQAIKILKSESIIPCAGISMAIGQYNRRLHEIDDEIRSIADQYALTLQDQEQTCEVEFQMAEPEQAQTTAPVETAATMPVEESTVSVAEPAPQPQMPAGQVDLSQFSEQQIADALVQIATLFGIKH